MFRIPDINQCVNNESNLINILFTGFIKFEIKHDQFTLEFVRAIF